MKSGRREKEEGARSFSRGNMEEGGGPSGLKKRRKEEEMGDRGATQPNAL